MFGTFPRAGEGAVGEMGVRGSAGLSGGGVNVISSSLRQEKGENEPGKSHSVCRRSLSNEGVSARGADGGGVLSRMDSSETVGAGTATEGDGWGGTNGILNMSIDGAADDGLGGCCGGAAVGGLVNMLDEKMLDFSDGGGAASDDGVADGRVALDGGTNGEAKGLSSGALGAETSGS